MADVTYEVKKQGQGQDISYLKKWVVLEVSEIDDADTITVSELTTVNKAQIVNLSDASEVGKTVVDNVITIDEAALADAHIIVLAIGV